MELFVGGVVAYFLLILHYYVDEYREITTDYATTGRRVGNIWLRGKQYWEGHTVYMCISASAKIKNIYDRYAHTGTKEQKILYAHQDKIFLPYRGIVSVAAIALQNARFIL